MPTIGGRNLNPDDPGEFLIWCLQNGSTFMALSFAGLVKKVRIKSARRKAGGPNRDGSVVEPEQADALVRLPVSVARELKGPRDEMNIYILVVLPRAAYEQAKSPIILPGLSDVRRTN